MIAAAAIAGGAQLAGGILNYLANMDAAERAEALRNKALQEYLTINIPDVKEKELALRKFASEGTISPEMEQAISQGPSEFEKIVVDGAQKKSQMRALQSLEELGYKGGLNLTDKAMYQDMLSKQQAQDRGARDAINSEMAQRGAGGSGFDLQAKLAAQQASGDRASRNSLNIAAQAQQRALQAIQGAGDLASKYRTQDVGEQQARAQAKDAINRFNVGNLQDVMSKNTALKNRAQEMNLNNAQDIANKNVGLTNQERTYNSSLAQKEAQRKFENQMQLAGAKSGIYSGQAGAAQQVGQMQGNAASNAGQGVADVAMSLGKSSDQDAFWDNYFKKQGKGV